MKQRFLSLFVFAAAMLVSVTANAKIEKISGQQLLPTVQLERFTTHQIDDQGSRFKVQSSRGKAQSSSAHALKFNPVTKSTVMASRRCAKSSKKLVKASESTDITIGRFTVSQYYEGEYYVVMDDAESSMEFIFDIMAPDNKIELGKTYTLADMYSDYSGIGDANDFDAWTEITAASYTETKDEAGLTHVTASMTDINGKEYNLKYDEKVFAPTGVKINVNATNLKSNYYSYYGEYAYSASNDDYSTIALWVYTDKALGTFNEEVDVEGSYLQTPSGSYVIFHSVATPLVVSEDVAGNKSLTGSIYDENGDEYVFNLTYEKPAPKEISISVDTASLDTKALAAGVWTIGGQTKDKIYSYNIYVKSKSLQGRFGVNDFDAYSTWVSDKSSGKNVYYENISDGNIASAIIGDSLYVAGTLYLADSNGNEAIVNLDIRTAFEQTWGEWTDFAPFGVNTGKYVFTSFFSSPQTQTNVPVQERKDNTGMKQYKLSGWGAGLVSNDGVEMIINRDGNNKLTVSPVYINYKTSGFEVWTMDAYSFSGGQAEQGTYDPETGVFKMQMISYLPEYNDYNWGASEETLTMDKPILERDTVDIVSTNLNYNGDYLESDKLVIYYAQDVPGYSVFRVTSNNATSVDGTYKWSEGGINSPNSYFTTVGSSKKNYYQDGEFTVVTEGKNIALTGWVIGTDEKYYRLDLSYTAPTTRDTVYVNGNSISVSPDYDDETGGQTGYVYQMSNDDYKYVVLQTVGESKYGTFSYDDKTLGRNYYNLCTKAGAKQQFKEGSATIAEAGDSIYVDGEFIAEDDKVYVLHFAKSNKKDTIDVNIVSYANLYFASTKDAYYTLNAAGYTFYYDIFLPEGLKDVENGVEYTLADMDNNYCFVNDSINETSYLYTDATFMKNETDSTVLIIAKAVTDNAVFNLKYEGKKQIVEPKGPFAVDFAAECVTIDESYLESYGDIMIIAEDEAGNGIELDLYDSKYADNVITPGVYTFSESGEDGTVYPGSLFYDVFPVPCLAYDADGNYWFLVSGTVTVTENSIIVDALDDEGESVKSVISLPMPTSINAINADSKKTMKYFDGKKVVIRKGDKNYSISGFEF